MKKLTVPILAGLSAATLITGCVLGNRTTMQNQPTVGQQLIDLQKAKDAGAITEEQYQSEKAQILDNKSKQ
ncbi:MAG TPA: SHOCT domain-containing protein [Verrucomicrobiae bacterium]|nr:SHOCT domain-containing protein [Verrucomicrobiae bacterium]